MYDLISRIPDQNGISQACYIIEVYHSGREPLINKSVNIHAHINVCTLTSHIHTLTKK